MTDEAPVVAVLPFATADVPSDRILSGGLVDDISGELTRFRALGVVSPASGAAVADLTDREAGKRLGATHLLRGTLRRQNGSIQVRTHLVECASGSQLWTDTIDVPENDLPLAEGDVAARITASLATRLEHAVLTDSRRKAVSSLAVYELTVQGFALLREGTFQADEEARALFRQALDQDPSCARAHAGVSLSWFNEWSCQYWSLFEENGRRAYTAAHQALALDDRDGMLHLVIGRICLHRREFEQAAWYIDRALALCPNDADLLIQMTLADALLGRADLAVEHADRAMRLNPYHPNSYYAYAATAHLAARDLVKSQEMFSRSDRPPFVDWGAYGAILYAHLGRLPEARRQLEMYHAEFERKIAPSSDLNPVEWFLQVSPFRRPEDREFTLEGLRLAGEAVEVAAIAEAGSAIRAGTAGINLFAEQGDVWQIQYDDRRVTVSDLKGLHDLRRLLSHPREPIHSLDLSGRGADDYTGDEALDERARREITRRVRRLQEDIDEAEGNNDIGTASRAREEMETLLETLSDSLGLGGRSRRLNDAAERARSAVTWRIRHAIEKVSAVHPELGLHLSNCVQTGTFCTYQPERPTRWRMAQPA